MGKRNYMFSSYSVSILYHLNKVPTRLSLHHLYSDHYMRKKMSNMYVGSWDNVIHYVLKKTKKK